MTEGGEYPLKELLVNDLSVSITVFAPCLSVHLQHPGLTASMDSGALETAVCTGSNQTTDPDWRSVPSSEFCVSNRLVGTAAPAGP